MCDCKRVYISADYDNDNGDKEVVDELNKWGSDELHKVNFIDMSKVASGTVANTNNCRPCDLKAEFNRQINASSAVIFVVGDKTKDRLAGSGCERSFKRQCQCYCTPYKQNANGCLDCNVSDYGLSHQSKDDCRYVNNYSYLRHEFEQAKKKKKKIIIVYNSKRLQSSWLPTYMSGYDDNAIPFWITNSHGDKVGNYPSIKKALGFE